VQSELLTGIVGRCDGLLMGRTHLVGDEARLVMAKGISHNCDLLIPFGTIQTARGLRASLCGLLLD
jgi:hypothetical protein